MTARARFICPWCAADDTEEPMFRSIQRALVEYGIRFDPNDTDHLAPFEYTGESTAGDEGCQHEYYRCLNCQHFFIEQAGNGLNVPMRCHEDADFALLLVVSGELNDIHEHGPDGWDHIPSYSEAFWQSTYASERACWDALRKK